MERILLGVFVLLLVLFIGNVFYKEAFADCSTPGQTTWTITVGPGSSSCSADGGSGGSSGSTSSSGSSSGGGSGRTYLDASGGRLADSVGILGSNSGSTSDSTTTSNTTQKKSMIELSLSDLLALIGSTRDSSGNRMAAPQYNYRYASMSIPQPPAPPAPQVYIMAGQPAPSLNTQFASDLRTAAPIDPNAGYEASPTFQDIPASSVSVRQGVNYVRGAPQNNPAENPEYIRKDSIPCYACSL